VCFGLREVRIDGAVESNVLPNTPPQVAAELAFLLIVAAVANRRRTVCARGHRRRCFEHETAPQVMKPIECPRLRQKVCIGANCRRPGILESGVLHATEDVETPALHSRILIPEALE